MRYRFTRDETDREILLTEVSGGVHWASSVATDEDRRAHAAEYQAFLNPSDEGETAALREKLATLQSEHDALIDRHDAVTVERDELLAAAAEPKDRKK